MPETLAPSQRKPLTVRGVLGAYRQTVTNRQTIGYALAGMSGSLLGLCAALAVETLWEMRLAVPWASFEAGSIFVLLLGGYLAAHAMALLPGALREYRGLDALERETAVFTRLIAEQGKGRAACETPELCYWAKSPFTFDFFNYGQRLFVGAAPMSGCASLFDGRTFPLLQLDPNKRGSGSFQLPAGCNAVIERNFRPLRISELGVLLAPRNPPELRASTPSP